MRTTTANYDTSNAVLQKKPVVKVAIGGFTNSYVSGPLVSIAATERKFEVWCGMELDKFESLIGDSTRVVEENKEYDEGALRDWLDSRYKDDVIQEFGEP